MRMVLRDDPGEENFPRKVVMPRKYAEQYIDRLLSGEADFHLSQLSSCMCSSPHFTLAQLDYGLPRPAFVFVETLCWLARSCNSGVWTYYEATPLSRQVAMRDALRALAPEEYATWYDRGMTDWEDEQRIRAVDHWIRDNQNRADEWLRQFALAHRDVVMALTAS
jgi:hypothetical protein